MTRPQVLLSTFLVLIGLVAGLAGVWLSRPPAPLDVSSRATRSTRVVEPPRSERTVPTPEVAGLASTGRAGDLVITPGVAAIEGEPPMIPSLALQRGELGWERQVRTLLQDSALSEAEKARALLGALATLPAEARESAAEEAIRRIPDEQYAIAQPHVTSAGTYGLALGVLFGDLMERPDRLRLPALLTIARNPQHPFSASARDNLDFIVGQDFGDDWVRWEAAIRTRLNAAP